ncbi:MAG: TetR/AcrR family transcriptional regulator [Actinobacteria bacterium]|nr:TetR/AcrR family transcriptional regulator [Actinomycetota bacterium]MCG2803570.1 TetR/AcrR family transcriptional regulator [Cellulomonas sp.]
MTTQVTRRTVLDPAARSDLIVDAAQKAFVERGIARTTVSDVARVAGVTRGLVYHYFPAMDDLVDAVLDRSVAAFVVRVQQWDAQREVGHIEQAVHDVVVMLREQVHPDHPLHLNLRDPANSAVYQRFVDRAVAAVVDCLQVTTVEAYAARHRIEITHVREVFTVLVHGLVGLVRTQPDVPDEVLASVVRQVLRLEPDAPAEGRSTVGGEQPDLG